MSAAIQRLRDVLHAPLPVSPEHAAYAESLDAERRIKRVDTLASRIARDHRPATSASLQGIIVDVIA